MPRASRIALALSIGLLGMLDGSAWAQPAVMPADLEGVDVVEHLDEKLPLDATFRDHTGKTVHLKDYFDGERPVALTLAYHTCEVVCSMVLGGAVDALKEQPWTLGEEYRALTISIDPRDTPEAAAKKRRQMMALYGREGVTEGWDFLVGDMDNIAKVARAVGFKFRYDERNDQYAHPAAMMLVKPNAELARYLYGLHFPVQDVRLGLLEASEGRSISTVEQVIMYCYSYDPIGAKYVIVAKNVVKLGGFITMVVLFGFLGVMWRREYKARFRGRPVAKNRPSMPPRLRA